jgi:hypothetical protein
VDPIGALKTVINEVIDPEVRAVVLFGPIAPTSWRTSACACTPGPADQQSSRPHRRTSFSLAQRADMRCGIPARNLVLWQPASPVDVRS